MRELKQLVFNLLENASGITIPSVINRIIVDYLPSGACDILNQELNLYTHFKSQAKTFDSIWKVETFRIQFRKILEEIVNENQSFHFSDFLLALPESKSYGQLTAHECLKHLLRVGIRFEGMICLEFSEFVRLYETYLPDYTALVRGFLQNILIFTENHDEITCSKDQFDFLLRLIQQYCSMPYRNSFLPFSLPKLPSIIPIAANFFLDKVSTKYLSTKEPIEQRRQRSSLNYPHGKLPNLDCFIFNNGEEYTFFIDRQNRSAIIELTEELPKQMAEWKAYQEQQAIQKWDFLHLLLLNTTSLPSSMIYIIIAYQALSSIDFLVNLLDKNFYSNRDNPNYEIITNFLPHPIQDYYTRLLIATQNQTLSLLNYSAVIEEELPMINVVSNPQKALAKLVKGGLPNTRPLLYYFLNIRNELFNSSSFHYQFIVEFITGILLRAETHACISLNEDFYTNISKLNKGFSLERLNEDSSLEQQSHFQDQLNELLSAKKMAPIPLVLQTEMTFLYVEMDLKETISYLEFLKQSQLATPSCWSCSHAFMFNKPQSSPGKIGNGPSEKITVEDILDAIKNDLRTLSETKPPRHMQLIALRQQEKGFNRSELTWLSDRIQKIKNINDYLLPMRTFIDLIAKEQSKAEESTLVERPGLK